MELQLPYQTALDDTLTHQVRFHLSKNNVTVSCICRKRTGDHDKAGKMYHEPIGRTANLAESRRLYNNPKNHWAPFTPDDEAKW